MVSLSNKAPAPLDMDNIPRHIAIVMDGSETFHRAAELLAELGVGASTGLHEMLRNLLKFDGKSGK